MFLIPFREGAIKNQLSDILGIFCGAGYLPSVYVTQEPGDAAKIAEEYGKDVELFVCSGGVWNVEQRDLRHHEAGKAPGDRISPGRFHE